MADDLKIFENPEFGFVRMAEIGGKPYFVGKDVAVALGYRDTVNALKQRCRGVVKHHLIDTKGRKQEMNLITEGDMYRLIIHSKLESAGRFEKWVFDEVLPSIRQHGGYIAKQGQLTDGELMARALVVAKKQIDERNRAIAQLEPYAALGAAVSGSVSSVSVGGFAKLLRQNGIETGQNRLFRYFREAGYLCKKDNLPTQRSIERGLFEIKESAYTDKDGAKRTALTPKLTGKGQQYFMGKFLGVESGQAQK